MRRQETWCFWHVSLNRPSYQRECAKSVRTTRRKQSAVRHISWGMRLILVGRLAVLSDVACAARLRSLVPFKEKVPGFTTSGGSGIVSLTRFALVLLTFATAIGFQTQRGRRRFDDRGSKALSCVDACNALPALPVGHFLHCRRAISLPCCESVLESMEWARSCSKYLRSHVFLGTLRVILVPKFGSA